MDKTLLHQFLQQHEEAGIAALHAQGYQWFKSEWMPRIRLADELLANQTELLADCWYLVGDVYDFNGAPLQAIQAYQQCLAYDENVDGAYRELAYHYELTGQYAEALTHVQKALGRLPETVEDEEVAETLEILREELLDLQGSIQDSLNYTVEPYLTSNNQAWVLSEQLAREEFKAVVTTVTALEAPNSSLLQRLAQAYAALGNIPAYQATWQQIAQQNDALEIGYADWFYLPTEVATQVDFWTCIKQVAPRVSELEINQHSSLEEVYGERLTAAELTTLVAQYHQYHCTQDQAGINNLQHQYPEWKLPKS